MYLTYLRQIGNLRQNSSSILENFLLHIWKFLPAFLIMQCSILMIRQAAPLEGFFITVHYRLRSIKQGQFRFSNFASHFKQKSYFHFLIHYYCLNLFSKNWKKLKNIFQIAFSL